MSARPGLRGGHRATGVPTAIANQAQLRFYCTPRGVDCNVNLPIQ